MKQIWNIILMLTAAGSIAASQPVVAENGPASSAVTVSVIIPAKAKIVSIDRIAPIAITAADIKNGAKDIPAAAALKVWSNSRNGFVLSSRLTSLRGSGGADAAGIFVLGKVAGSANLQPVVSDFQDIYYGTKADRNVTDLMIDFKLLLDPWTKPGQYFLEPDFTVNCL
ncbi:MAG: hypothetical protein QME74_07795 [Candidatus Edwardsbacteria bacterium]|nr:hypothetical protein [Candidatus Edwardsbacteria bacterium]